ncbi:MAG: non-homologous end-joining DNA ligase, partial [Ignavibacteriaceae bacterium]
MGLAKYKQKRNFKKTSEPSGTKKTSKNALKFVVQKHNATRLHYDFRLELDGVLKSWAVPKGPSLNPEDKRLAMMVEDHPYDYRTFEGIIPDGNYGAGEVIIWDEGTYHSLDTDDKKESEKFLRNGLDKGDLKFVLHGKKLNGAYALVKMKGRGENSWLLIKKKDEFATEEDVTQLDESVVSGKTLSDLKLQDGHNKKKKSEKAKTTPPGKFSGKDLPGVKSKMPASVKPMLATLVKEPFDDPDWLFEIKWDGYRAVAEINDGKVNLHSRKNLSFNTKFSPVAEALKKIDNKVILDGEVVVLNDKGKSEFQLLQNYQRTGAGNLVYFVFDILYLDGHNLKDLPLIERKNILKEFLPESDIIKYSDHIISDGIAFFEAAGQNALEGIIAKRQSSPYQVNKRSKDWLKMKTQLRQEAVIAGFTKPRGSRKAFGALVLGTFEDNELKYIGHTGGGFNDTSLKEIKQKLDPLVTKTSPFKKKPKTNTPVTWVEPKLVCEVVFSEWTED